MMKSFNRRNPMRMLIAALTMMMTSGSAFAQSAPARDLSAEALIDALTPPARPLTRGISPQLREEDMPSIDLAVEFEFASHALTVEAQALLANLAAALQAPALETHRFRLAGHTDAVGRALLHNSGRRGFTL